jgi:hypothetical protein
MKTKAFNLLCVFAFFFGSTSKLYSYEQPLTDCTFVVICDNDTKVLIQQLFKTNSQDVEKYEFLQGHPKEMLYVNKDIRSENLGKVFKLCDSIAERNEVSYNLKLPISISECSLIVDERTPNAVVLIMPTLTSYMLNELNKVFSDIVFSYKSLYGDEAEKNSYNDAFKIKNKSHLNAVALKPFEIKGYIKYAAIAATAYKSDTSWITPFNIDLISPKDIDIDVSHISCLEKRDVCFFDETTGLKAIVCENEKNIIIAFGAFGSAFPETGTEKYNKVADYLKKTIVHNIYFGSKPKYFDDADLLFKKLCSYFGEKSTKPIIVCGQCLGGSLAQYVGIKNRVSTICLNSIPIGSGVQKAINKNIHYANKIVTQVSVDFDPVISSSSAKNLGEHFVLPSAYETSKESHRYLMGSIMNYLGYDKKTHTKELVKEDLVY